MRQGTANLNRMIRKNSQIKWLSEQLKERRQEATGTSGGGTFSRMDSERKRAKVGEGGHMAGTVGNPVGLTRVMIFRRQSWQPSTGTWTAPLQKTREGGRLRHRCRHLSGWGGGQPLKSRNDCRQPQLGGKEQEMFKVLGEMKYEAVSRREGKWPRQTNAEWVPGDLKAGHELRVGWLGWLQCKQVPEREKVHTACVPLVMSNLSTFAYQKTRLEMKKQYWLIICSSDPIIQVRDLSEESQGKPPQVSLLSSKSQRLAGVSEEVGGSPKAKWHLP